MVGGNPFDFQNHYDSGPINVHDNMGQRPLGPRYSEFLPTIWKSEIRDLGSKGERSLDQGD